MAHAEEAYPLQWPVGWPRVRYASRSKFGRRTMYVAREFLEHELRLLGARGIVLSTNVPLRQDGLPYSNAAEPRDHGAAVYFRIKDQPRVLACDKWDRVADNVMAIVKHVEAIRGQVRWGVGSVEQALGGYKALPEMGAPKQWWEVLGLPRHSGEAAVEARRLELLQEHHPDRGGSSVRAAEINAAYDEARRELQGAA
jgi:hypothetical protein